MNLSYVIMGVLILNDIHTGSPLAFMDANWITAVRTAAVTAVAAKYCARKDSEIVGVIGAGVQGTYNVLNLHKVLPKLKQVKVYDIQLKAVETYVKVITEKTGLEVIPVESPKAAVIDSDIVITAAQRLEKPIIQFEWLKKGVFGVGLESGKVWGETVKKMDTFITDDWEQTKLFESQGSFPGGLPEVYTEIGQIIIGQKNGRQSEDENIIACNVGLAIEDIAVGKMIYERAKKKKVGMVLPA